MHLTVSAAASVIKQRGIPAEMLAGDSRERRSGPTMHFRNGLASDSPEQTAAINIARRCNTHESTPRSIILVARARIIVVKRFV
jgi:hypothetical protein